MRNKMRILAATVLIALAPLAAAQTSGGDTPTANQGQALVASKIASNFTTLAGGEDNALALVNALRTGGDVTLVTTVPGTGGAPATTTETTFAVPTKPMGWGNVKHALALAQYSLQQAGITNPTAEQLQIALTGGDLVVVNADGSTTTTTLKGILTMRADGMGWGNIAKASGTKLGPVTSKVDMSGGKKPAATTTTTSTTTTTTAAGGTTTTTKSKGVTTAAGSTVGSSHGKGPSSGITTAGGATSTHGSQGLVTAGGASAGANPSGNAYGRGLVTGAGGGATSVGATMGHGHGGGGGGAGLVTAGGGSGAGITNAGGGNAGGNGKGHGKGGKGG